MDQPLEYAALPCLTSGLFPSCSILCAAYNAADTASGTQVAVKVRHPGVVKSIQRDFALMLQAAKLVAIIPAIGKMRPEETLAQFAAPLQEQVPPGHALPAIAPAPPLLPSPSHASCILPVKPSATAFMFSCHAGFRYLVSLISGTICRLI